MSLEIISIKSYLPRTFETLKNLKKTNFGWDIDKIYSSTGINKRYCSSKNEDVISLSIKSAKKVLNKNNRSKIGFLLVVTQTSPYKLPSTACIIQNKLNLPNNIFAADINMGCSGFIYALKLAEKLLDKSKKNLGLIICCDTYTKYIKKNNKSCRPIFSDASSTTLLKKNRSSIIGPFDFGVDGSGYKDLFLKNSSNNIFMNGPKIAIFTLNKIPEFINNFIIKNKIPKEKIKLIALHQASKYVCKKIEKKLNLNKKIFYNNFEKVGNAVSASIPILLESAFKEKKIKKNDTIIACGFGVGLSWGITKIKWTQKKQ